MESVLRYYATAVATSAESFAAMFPYPFLVRRPRTGHAQALAPTEHADADAHADDEPTGATILLSQFASGDDLAETQWLVAPLTPRRRTSVMPPAMESAVDILASTPRAITVGRSRSHDVVLRFGSVSQSHATIWVTSNHGIEIVDANSTNGTFVNSTRLRAGLRARARSGDELRFGLLAMMLMSPVDFHRELASLAPE